MKRNVEFVETERGDDSFFIKVDGVRHPFLGFGPVRSANISGKSYAVCCVKKEVDGEELYSICIDGRCPPPDDWFLEPVGIVRLHRGGVRCRVQGGGRYCFSWPAEQV